MPHSWDAYDKAQELIQLLLEMDVINSKGLRQLSTIQGSIQIVLER